MIILSGMNDVARNETLICKACGCETDRDYSDLLEDQADGEILCEGCAEDDLDTIRSYGETDINW